MRKTRERGDAQKKGGVRTRQRFSFWELSDQDRQGEKTKRDWGN